VNRQGNSPHIFGVRHLSPGGAFHLRQFLETLQPTAVLVEGLSDANDQIEHFTHSGTIPPIAILAYTEELPVRTLLYPFAEYSPEYQALLWAKEHGALAEFIDLPSDVMLKLDYAQYQLPEGEPESNRSGIYEEWARLAGEADHEAYWERHFEHNLNPDVYRLAAWEFGQSLRELSSDNRIEQAKNLIREAYMRNRIQKVIAAGHEPDRVVVVTGAYHAAVLGAEYEPMTNVEIAALPRVKTKLTLMPYSYYRLSSQSGYGAGNHAPAYFELMWQCLCTGDLAKLPALYLAQIVKALRTAGTPRSAAEVIEGVRLANTMAALHEGSAPILKDLRDAATVCLGHGELAVVAEAMARIEIGTAIGSLPEGVSRTAIQDDFYREIKRLKLDKYQTPVAQNLELDLRENRRVKSEEAAFLDLNRSFFLHRLQVLRISFQQAQNRAQHSATWAESWVLRWTPEAEIELVESALKGETVELATALVFQSRLEQSANIAAAAGVVREACECGMMDAMEQARIVLQRLAVDSGAFAEVADAAADLAMVIGYGDIRRFVNTKLIPLLQQLFLRGTLLLVEAANCDQQAAGQMVEAIHRMNAIALEHFAVVDEAYWIKQLTELADRDDRNPKLSGYACAILLERNLMEAEKLAQEVARRLSPGIAADLGAGWFEGLSLRNRYALLARLSLWEQIATYVASLDEEQFKRALVFLRRAFGGFGTVEKRTICENLGEIWGIGQETASDLLRRELSEAEQQSIDELKDFDFGDI
jgi:hypothetical protein